jgi:hypothetical protein
MLGIIFTLVLFIEKLENIHNPHARQITQKPLFFLALTAIIIGVPLFLAGFLGELISRSSSDRNNYQIRQRIK